MKASLLPRLFCILIWILLPMLCAHAETHTTQNDEIPSFFSALQDIPLMPGLEELEDQTVFFDKPEGRIISVLALMHKATPNQVSLYYKTSLPQFGWIPTDENLFLRRNESLNLSFEKIDNDNILKITVKPAL